MFDIMLHNPFRLSAKFFLKNSSRYSCFKVEPKGPKEALVIWDVNDKSLKWNYGVDISYRLKNLGGCNEVGIFVHCELMDDKFMKRITNWARLV